MTNTVQEELQKAIDILGLTNMARQLGIKYQTIRKWQKVGRMPRTEYTEETRYSREIQKLTRGLVKSKVLCPKIRSEKVNI